MVSLVCDSHSMLVTFILFRLLHVQNANCKYKEADQTYKSALKICELAEQEAPTNKASLYTECCALLFAESQYDEVCTDLIR